MSRELRGYRPPSEAPIVASPERDVILAHRDIDIADREDRQYLRAIVGNGLYSSTASWINFRRIGEVRYAITRSALIAGYTKYAAVRTSPAGATERVANETGVIAEIVGGITSRFGGLRALNQRYYTLMKVPGEALLIRVREGDTTDGYWYMSPDEIVDPDPDVLKSLTEPVGWRTARIRGSNGDNTTFHRKVLREDFYGRVWMPDPQFTDECDTPFNEGLNELCDMLWKLTESIKGRIMQRFAVAGILLIPSQINDAAISGEKPGDRMFSDDKVLNYLIHVMTTNRMRMDRAMDQIPILLKGDADVLDKVRHMVIDPTIAETDLKLRGELLDKILSSLDQPKLASTDNEGSNHWTAWATSEQERRIGVQPVMDGNAHVLTRMILWRELQARGWTPGQIRPWKLTADLTDASVRTNHAEDVRQGYDRGIVGDQFARDTFGATLLDAPTPEEAVRWWGRKFGDPYTAFWGLPGLEALDLDKIKVGKAQPGPTSKSPGDDPKAGPGVGEPGAPESRDSDDKKGDTPS